MIFGKRIYFDPSADGGGAAPAAPSAPASAPAAPAMSSAAPVDAPSAQPSSGGVPATVVPPAGSPPPSGASPAPAAAAPKDTGYVIVDKLPARDDVGYAAAFKSLSFEDQIKVEQEINALHSKADPELEKLLNEKLNNALETDATKPPDPSAPVAPDAAVPEIKAITKDVFDALPPEVQATVKTMNEEIARLQQYDDDKFQAGLSMIQKDPIMKKRAEQLAKGLVDPDGVTEELQRVYNPNDHVTADDIAGLDFSTPEKAKESNAILSNKLHEAAQRGYNIAKEQGDAARVQFQQNMEVKVNIEKQLNEMVLANPSMKSDLAYDHADHPLAPFFNWVGKNFTAKQFANIGPKNVFLSYQSATGGLQTIIDKQVSETKKKVFLDLTSMEDTARNLTKDVQGPKEQTGQMYNGVDLARYKTDRAYAARMYEGADWETQKGLERYKVSGQIPKK